jgi:hypothetical protein
METVRVMVRERAFVCITLQPLPRRCRSIRFQPPSRYDLEEVPCWTAVAIWHYAGATRKKVQIQDIGIWTYSWKARDRFS